MTYDTDQRQFDLHTPLPDDTLLLLRFRGEEGLSRLYGFELELASEQMDIDAADLIGKPVRLGCQTEDDQRFWCGYVSRFSRAGQSDRQFSQDGALTFYRMQVVPWLWFMQHHEDSRIFQNLSIPDIIEKLFAEFGYSDYEFKLDAHYPPLVYCTQYRESVFQFFCRLLERAGIYWYFRHDDSNAVLVLADSADSHPAIDAHDDGLRYHDHDMSAQTDAITGLTRTQELRTGRIAVNDYHFERPGLDLHASLDTLMRIGGNTDYERYVHPGGYSERDEADRAARILLEAEEARHETLQGQGHVRRMRAGQAFTLYDHPQDELNQRYLITGVWHEGENNVGGAGGNDDTQADYRNRFTALPIRVPYRSPMATPRPRIPGPQTAIVAGPEGEEIYVDKYGRIKLHFFWDRRSRRNDKSSCWVRVAQMWAGRQWGAMFLPRVGHEVIVEFLEGDPDQPIVTGSVYNGDNLPPYALPEHATRSTVKTLSSKGGEGFNELRFEDKKGQEQVFLHAQKDLDQRVGNDVRTWTGNSSHHIIGGDRIEKTLRDHSLNVVQDRIAAVGRNDALEVMGDRTVFVHGDRAEAVNGVVHNHTNGRKFDNIKGHYDMVVHMNALIECLGTLTLKVGPSSITLSNKGITIDGPMVEINCGATASSTEEGWDIDKPLKPKDPAQADEDRPGHHHVPAPITPHRS